MTQDQNKDRQQTLKPEPIPLGVTGTVILGTLLAMFGLMLIYLVYEFWPAKEALQAGATTTVQLFSCEINNVSPDVRLLLLVMVVGALGSFVHIATSFADYVGNKKMTRSWIWWYIHRPLIGVSLALIFYFVIRGGLLSAGANASDVSRFGIAAVAGLVGMFSKLAADKLEELFSTLFKIGKGKGDELREDKLFSQQPKNKES